MTSDRACPPIRVSPLHAEARLSVARSWSLEPMIAGPQTNHFTTSNPTTPSSACGRIGGQGPATGGPVTITRRASAYMRRKAARSPRPGCAGRAAVVDRPCGRPWRRSRFFIWMRRLLALSALASACSSSMRPSRVELEQRLIEGLAALLRAALHRLLDRVDLALLDQVLDVRACRSGSRARRPACRRCPAPGAAR